jgi:hypothetical protein
MPVKTLAASPEVCEIDVPLGSDPLGIFDNWTEPFMDDRQPTLVARRADATLAALICTMGTLD